MNQEFTFKASTLNFWHLLFFSLVSMTVGLTLSHFILPHMNATQVIFAGCVTLILMQLVLYSQQFLLHIKLMDGRFIIHKNGMKVMDIPITEIEKLQARDIDDHHPIGDLRVFIKDQSNFYFSLLIVSDSRTKREQEQNLRALLRAFIQQYHFKKEGHDTRFGKSKYVFEYSNRKA